MTKYWVEWSMYVVYIYKSFIFNLFLTCLLLLTWLLLFMCFLGICVGGSTRAILKIARAWVQFFRKRAKKCWKRTIYLKIEQKWTHFEKRQVIACDNRAQKTARMGRDWRTVHVIKDYLDMLKSQMRWNS